jgi:hypothetical protein
MPNQSINRRLNGAKPLSALNKEWLGRVLAAGGQRPSKTTFKANDAFWKALLNAGIDSKVKIANLFPFEDIPTVSTPLIQGPGPATWTNPGTAFVSADLTIDGLRNPISGVKSFGLIPPGNFMTASTGHGMVYVSLDDTSQGSCEYGVNDNTGLNDFVINTHWTDNHTYAYDYAQAQLLDAGIISAGALLGYFCVSRTANNRVDLYYATSVSVHTSKANNTSVNAAVPSVINNLAVFALNNGGSLLQRSQKRFSAVTFGLGLTSTESQSLFNAVQNYRQAIGGGFS